MTVQLFIDEGHATLAIVVELDELIVRGVQEGSELYFAMSGFEDDFL